jgi:hypothetical protein
MRGTAIRGSIRVRGEDTWFVRWENGIETYMPDEATARASAAALDLLAALKDTTEHLEALERWIDANMPEESDGGNALAAAINLRVQAAIAKAGS